MTQYNKRNGEVLQSWSFNLNSRLRCYILDHIFSRSQFEDNIFYFVDYIDHTIAKAFTTSYVDDKLTILEHNLTEEDIKIQKMLAETIN